MHKGGKNPTIIIKKKKLKDSCLFLSFLLLMFFKVFYLAFCRWFSQCNMNRCEIGHQLCHKSEDTLLCLLYVVQWLDYVIQRIDNKNVIKDSSIKILTPDLLAETIYFMETYDQRHATFTQITRLHLLYGDEFRQKYISN